MLLSSSQFNYVLERHIKINDSIWLAEDPDDVYDFTPEDYCRILGTRKEGNVYDPSIYILTNDWEEFSFPLKCGGVLIDYCALCK